MNASTRVAVISAGTALFASSDHNHYLDKPYSGKTAPTNPDQGDLASRVNMPHTAFTRSEQRQALTKFSFHSLPKTLPRRQRRAMARVYSATAYKSGARLSIQNGKITAVEA